MSCPQQTSVPPPARVTVTSFPQILHLYFSPTFLTATPLTPVPLIFLTIAAQAAELKLVVRDMEPGPAGYPPVQLPVHRLIDIEYPATPVAPEMVVIVLPPLKPAHRTAEVQLRDLARLQQYPQVTIDRSFTDIWYCLPHLVIYPVGGGVRGRASQCIQNSLSLLRASVHEYPVMVLNINCTVSLWGLVKMVTGYVTVNIPHGGV